MRIAKGWRSTERPEARMHIDILVGATSWPRPSRATVRF
jgi:hypothetical protein